MLSESDISSLLDYELGGSGLHKSGFVLVFLNSVLYLPLLCAFIVVYYRCGKLEFEFSFN